MTLGCKWKTILTKLHLAFSDPVIGYPRLQLAVDLALKDSELMKYPLLHADVLIYKLDESFAEGNQKYSNDSSSANWDQTTSRLPGESAHSLSIRVENAYLELHEELDAVSIYLPGYSADQLIGRYCECLYNDPSDPDRGERSAHEAKLGWDKDMAAYRFPGSVPKDPPTLERIARFWVAPTEASYKPEPDQGRLEAIDEYPNSKPLALGYNAPEKPVMYQSCQSPSLTGQPRGETSRILSAPPARRTRNRLLHRAAAAVLGPRVNFEYGRIHRLCRDIHQHLQM